MQGCVPALGSHLKEQVRLASTSHLNSTRVPETLERTDMMQSRILLQRALAISVISGQKGEKYATLGPGTCW